MKISCFLLILMPFQVFSLPEQPTTETQRLAQLCKIWGFLKYYHPQVAAGKIDWDAHLITLIPKVRQATTTEQVSEIYLQVLEELGPVKACPKCSQTTNKPQWLTRNLDLAFLTDSFALSPELRQKLLFIKQNRYQRTNYYVSPTRHTGQADFSHENSYPEMKTLEEPYRLLSLFRYWNAIHYFFPYKYAMDQDWNQVLMTLIPVFQQASDSLSYPKALSHMVASIQDSHGFLNRITHTKQQMQGYYVPFDIKFIDKKMVITGILNDTLAKLDDLKVGNVITQIDGKPVEQLVEEQRNYVPASNEAVFYRNLKYVLLPGKTARLTLSMEFGGKLVTKTVNRYPFSQLQQYSPQTRNVCEWPTNDIGYINMGKLEVKQVDSVMSALQKSKAIIIDLRNYPKSTMYHVSRFLNPKATTFSKLTKPDFAYPGSLDSTYHMYTGRINKKFYKGKVLLLVNEETQSQAEFTTMILQTAPKAIVVGSQTAGADGDICWLPLPGGYRTAFSGLGVYYPDGRETQRVGIVLDVEVLPTIQGIREGRDEVLEKAIQLAEQY